MRALRGEGGQATTEVMVFPVLLLLFSVVVQFALWYHAGSVAQAAAAEGVRAARAAGSAPAGARRAEAFLAELGPSVVVAPKVVAERGPERARVEVTGQAVRLLPLLPLPVRAAAESPVEAFRPVPREFGNSEGSAGSNPRVAGQ